MGGARVLIVHESERTRSLLCDLLVREGLKVEVAESSFDCMARFVEDPVDLVIAGLGGLAEAELGLFRSLKKEPSPPVIIATFPSGLRDFAVRALEQGADSYVLEPFYAAEIVAAVQSQLAARPPEAPSTALPHLAREVAHAINNPLQVMTLLLHKDKATKKELQDGVQEQIGRIEQVIALLKQFGAVSEAEMAETDPLPLVQRAVRETGLSLDSGRVSPAMLDDRRYVAALTAGFAALQAHAGEGGGPLRAEVRDEGRSVVVRVTLPDQAHFEIEPSKLLDAVFVVRANRDVLPGLALPRALLESQHGSLEIERDGMLTRVVARIPKASA